MWSVKSRSSDKLHSIVFLSFIGGTRALLSGCVRQAHASNPNLPIPPPLTTSNRRLRWVQRDITDKIGVASDESTVRTIDESHVSAAVSLSFREHLFCSANCSIICRFPRRPDPSISPWSPRRAQGRCWAARRRPSRAGHRERRPHLQHGAGVGGESAAEGLGFRVYP